MNDQKIEDQVVQLISKYSKDHPEKIKSHSRIAQDIGLDGDDAFDFMKEYFSTFSVDTKGFEYPDYFLDEGFSMFGLFRKVYPEKRRQKKTITVGQLQKNAVSKKWED